MAKLAFPQCTAPYRGAIGEFRFYLQRMATFRDESSGAVADLRNMVATFLGYIGSALVTGGTNLTVSDASGTTQATPLVTAADGTVTSAIIPTTSKIIKSTVKVIMPAATGSYVNGYTFTIVNGAITAAVAS